MVKQEASILLWNKLCVVCGNLVQASHSEGFDSHKQRQCFQPCHSQRMALNALAKQSPVIVNPATLG